MIILRNALKQQLKTNYFYYIFKISYEANCDDKEMFIMTLFKVSIS